MCEIRDEYTRITNMCIGRKRASVEVKSTD